MEFMVCPLPDFRGNMSDCSHLDADFNSRVQLKGGEACYRGPSEPSIMRFRITISAPWWPNETWSTRLRIIIIPRPEDMVVTL
jgi:hypothetical protein